MISFDELRHAWKRGGILIGVVAATGGFIADVLQPIAPFSQYLFLISLACTVIALGAYFVVLQQYRRPTLTILICAVITSSVTGGLVAVQRAAGAEQGLLPELIPGVDRIQCSLGIVQEEVCAVRKKAASIETHTVSILKDTGEIKEVMRDLDHRIEAIRLPTGGGAGIIAAPQKPEDYYHNARIYELGGDYGNARTSYEAYFASAAHHVDAHRRFQAFLKIQEGLAGARAVYRRMIDRMEEPVVRLAMILLDDPETRAAELEPYIAANPECAPAYYEFSLLYSKKVLGAQSAFDKKKEKELLSRFLALLDEGKFYRYYVDHEEAEEIVAEAKERFAALETFDVAVLENPVSLIPMRGSNGWTLTITVADTATDISYRLAGQAQFTSTGTTAYVSPSTGRPVPRGCFELPGNAQAQTIQIKYRDFRGIERGPFACHFTPGGSLPGDPMHILNMTKKSWINIQTGTPNSLIYFTHLLAYRDDLSEIRYGVNTDIPDQTLPLSPCDASNPLGLDAAEPVYIEYPGSVDYAVVQLVFADGTTSTVEKFQ